MTHDEMIAVIAAHRDGKKIQLKSTNGDWFDCSQYPRQPIWAFDRFEYRIAPSPPKPREYSVRLCPDKENGLPEIAGIKRDWIVCGKCEVFHVREVFPSTGEENT